MKTYTANAPIYPPRQARAKAWESSLAAIVVPNDALGWRVVFADLLDRPPPAYFRSWGTAGHQINVVVTAVPPTCQNLCAEVLEPGGNPAIAYNMINAA